MVERLDQQEIRDVRVHDAPSLSLKFLQRVGVEIAPYLLARERVLKNDARLIAAVFAFAGHNKTPPKIHCGIIPEGVIYTVMAYRVIAVLLIIAQILVEYSDKCLGSSLVSYCIAVEVVEIHINIVVVTVFFREVIRQQGFYMLFYLYQRRHEQCPQFLVE